MSRPAGAFRVLLALTVVLALAATAFPTTAHPEDGNPTRSTHWLSLINMAHMDPTALTVIIVPPAYVSVNAMVLDTGWVGTDAPTELPAVRATLEAVEYWAWAIDQHATAYPSAQLIDYSVRILGVDATEADLRTADIVINTAMVADPMFFIFHAGLGLPTFPVNTLFGSHGGTAQGKCTVWNTGLGTTAAAEEPLRLRNLVLHEFGHCLAVGHTGTSLGLNHCSDHHGCFDQHPTDIMSSVFGDVRQCISNLNVQSLDEAYRPFATTGSWGSHDEETFMKKSDYATVCLPAALERF